MKINVSQVRIQDAREFLESFFLHRNINREFYENVPEEKFDFRMVDNSKTKSDSPRESLIHQIYVTRKYLYGIKTGVLKFDGIIDKNLPRKGELTKKQLLNILDETGKELTTLLKNPQLLNKKISVPWRKNPILILACLSGLHNHEILHTGWNLALMDFLGIKRFSSLKEMWG